MSSEIVIDQGVLDRLSGSSGAGLLLGVPPSSPDGQLLVTGVHLGEDGDPDGVVPLPLSTAIGLFSTLHTDPAAAEASLGPRARAALGKSGSPRIAFLSSAGGGDSAPATDGGESTANAQVRCCVGVRTSGSTKWGDLDGKGATYEVAVSSADGKGKQAGAVSVRGLPGCVAGVRVRCDAAALRSAFGDLSTGAAGWERVRRKICLSLAGVGGGGAVVGEPVRGSMDKDASAVVGGGSSKGGSASVAVVVDARVMIPADAVCDDDDADGEQDEGNNDSDNDDDGDDDGDDGGDDDDGDDDGGEPNCGAAPPPSGPSFHWSKQAPGSGVDVSLDAVVGVLAEDTVRDLVGRCVDALAAQLREVDQPRGGSRPAASPWHFMHFLPRGVAHYVTVAYPGPAGGALDDAAESNRSIRASYHTRLALPLDRPALRSAYGSQVFGNGGDGADGADGDHRRKGWSRHLRNVHEGLPPSGVDGGTLSIVHGEYEYYHYMQDNFDDDGWGCAYRSLQTICSWIALQQMTTKPVPSHREIQETLVRVKDKESKFVGSKQWIGAFECALCLDHWYGMPCKILNVNSGAELAEKGRELAQHFERNGSPVMIGGGVLAYTLLGIDFNPLTGDIAFLILDPHYVGNDDMRVIHKSWCKWHRVDLFRADAFYNLCCPQRIAEI